MVRSTRASRQAEEELKKGPWTPEEDQKLIAYIQKHGHGNWRALPKKSGLQRCGKSCRLRWTNYLRPDIKRGLFTNSEKQKIIQLHALVGNRWAFIASQLPNRTDNEIKNYWNTVLKKAAMTRSPASTLTRGQVLHSNGSPNCPSVSRSSCSSSHLAQWESARLQAEARLSALPPTKPTLPHSLLFSRPCKYTGTTIPAIPPFPYSAASTTPGVNFPTSASVPTLRPSSYNTHAFPNSTLGPTSAAAPLSCIPTLNVHTYSPTLGLTNVSKDNTHTHYPPTPVPTDSCPFLDTLSLISLDNAKPNVINPSILPSTVKPMLDLLSSPASVGSALTLGSNGHLSWKTQELSFKDPPPLVPVSNGLIESHGEIKARYNDPNGIDEDLDHRYNLAKATKGHEASPVEATCSSMDLNSMISLSSSYSWHELLFEVENGTCSSEVISPISGGYCHEPTRPKGSHPQELEKGIPSLINYKPRSVNESCKGYASHMQDSNMPESTSSIRVHEEIDMTQLDVEILTFIMD